jgi:N utilization substance protein B
MATRAQARQAVVGLLYAYDLGNEDIANYSDELLEDNKIRNKQREFALRLFNGVMQNLAPIDVEIEKHLKGWEFSKLGKVERAILRLCVYEICFTDLDSAIVINEAVELSKKLASEQSPKFVNGVLDAVAKDAKDKK